MEVIAKICYQKEDSYKRARRTGCQRSDCKMTIKLVTLAIFAVSLSVVSSFPHKEVLDCKGKPDGVYPDPDDKRGYYVCMDNRPFVHLDCDEGEHYDDSFKTCVKDVPAPETPQNYVSQPEEDMKGMKEELSQFLGDGEGQPDWPEAEPSSSKYKVYNVQFTENIFPRSVVIIGKANREQKNK